MPAHSKLPRDLLGGLNPARFLAEYWQRKPLLIRQAVDKAILRYLPDTTALFELARRDDVEARLITHTHGKWKLDHGPFESLPLRKRAWTLLVQGVNLYHAGADAMMRSFSFLPEARLDDAMFSYAADGGGVGPHFDSYDVFLLQVEGQRRWRIGDQGDLETVSGAPLKILRRFICNQEWILEPGDMLYLPPRYAHEGTAIGPCVTCSIGFRAPSNEELVREFLFDLAERVSMPGRYGDRSRMPVRHPAQLDKHMTEAMLSLLPRIDWKRRDIEEFLGRYLTEPKPSVFFATPAPLSARRFLKDALRHGLQPSLKTRMQYRGRRIHVNGEAFDMPADAVAWLRQFADRRCAMPAACAILQKQVALTELLHDWHAAGWIEIGTKKVAWSMPS